MFLTRLMTVWRDRRPGSRSVVQRQEDYLQDEKVKDRRWVKHDTPEGAVNTRVATLDPQAETVTPVDEDTLAGLRQNAEMAFRFVHDHVANFDAPTWSLQDLDDAFAAWTAHGDKAACPPQAVEAIVSAAFGEYCVRTLGMQWVSMTDSYGQALAVEGAASGQKYKDMRTFPFAVVGKRIDSGESHFLVSIFRVLQDGMRP